MDTKWVSDIERDVLLSATADCDEIPIPPWFVPSENPMHMRAASEDVSSVTALDKKIITPFGVPIPAIVKSCVPVLVGTKERTERMNAAPAKGPP